MFIQLSKLATMHLHNERMPKPILEEIKENLKEGKAAVEHQLEKRLSRKPAAREGEEGTKGKLCRPNSPNKPSFASTQDVAQSPAPAPQTPEARTPVERVLQRNQGSHAGSLGASDEIQKKRRKTSSKKHLARAGTIRQGNFDNEEDLFNQTLFTPEEVAFFGSVEDKDTGAIMHSQISRIIRAITTRRAAGGVKAPAPIVSRVFQEISNGVLAYNNAYKLKEVPVPFALVHFNAMLLIFFVVTAPLVVSCFTGNPVMSIVSSCLITCGFASLWLVANELEDPFGYDENDIAMVQYHEVCARAVERTISNHGHRSVSPRARNPPPTSASPATK